jgi:hypothetical protein
LWGEDGNQHLALSTQLNRLVILSEVGACANGVVRERSRRTSTTSSLFFRVVILSEASA